MTRGSDVRHFEGGFVVGELMAGASGTNTAQLVGVSIGTKTKVHLDLWERHE